MEGNRKDFADKGSKYHLQTMVNDHEKELNHLICAASPSMLAFGVEKIDWKSPLKGCNPPFYEYRDDFLKPLGLEEHEQKVREFWPNNGPQWDGLALVDGKNERGSLLVEAKAHPSETKSDSKASNKISKSTIHAAFDETRKYMGIQPNDWEHDHYQLANRLAFLYLLNVKMKVPSWLVLINFINDRTHKPTSLDVWIAEYSLLFSRLGLKPDCLLMNRVITLFIPATDA